MKRKVKFRGYQPELKKWVYGNLVRLPYGACFILDYQDNFEDRIDVQPDSVGQEAICGIYEGDILKLNVCNSEDLYIVEWHDAGFMGKRINKPKGHSYSTEYIGLCHYFDIIEVVGNAYQNPELLNQ